MTGYRGFVLGLWCAFVITAAFAALGWVIA